MPQTDEQLRKYARETFDGGMDYTTIARQLDFEERKRFKPIWDNETQPKTYGEAFQRGLDPATFVNSIGDMMASMGELFVATQYPEAWKLTREITKAVIAETLSDGPTPVRDELARILGEEFLYFTDSQLLKNKIANQPAEIISDIASVAAALASGGISLGARAGMKAPRLMKILSATQKTADIIDPANLPSHAFKGTVRGLEKSTGGLRNPASAETFNKPAEYKVGSETREITPLEGASEFGAGELNTPDSVLNPSDVVSRKEFSQRATQAGRGKQKLEATQEATARARERMKAGDLSLEDTLNHVVTGYEEVEFQDTLDFRQMFRAIRANFTDDIPTDHDWRKNLDKALASLESPEVNNPDLHRIRSWIDLLIVDRGKGVRTLNGLDEFRTKFRQQLLTPVNREQISGIGSGTAAEKVYAAISDDLYDSIDATVDASGGRLPATLKDEVRAAKAAYAARKRLEETPGGKFILKKQTDSKAMVNDFLYKLERQDIQDAFKLIGEEKATEVQAGLLNAIFEKASGPTGLQRQLGRINERHPNRLIELFGGGDRGKKIAEQLGALGAFEARSAEAVRLARGSPTGQVNTQLFEKMHAISAGTSGVYTIWDIAQWLFRDQDVGMAAMITGSFFGQWAVRTGVTKHLDSQTEMRRITQGILPDEAFDDFLKGFEKRVGHGLMKTLEVEGRLGSAVGESFKDFKE